MTRAHVRPEMPTVQEVLAQDVNDPPPPFLESAPKSFGLNDISMDRYVSKEFHRREMRYLWSRTWQWAGREEDIPDVGDYLVYDIGDRSVLLVRSAPDRVQAFYNSCLHRGTQLKEERGNDETITCRFHAWSWNLDGSLRDIPCRWDFPQLDGRTLRLPEVRLECWAGFLFINFDATAPPLSEVLDVLPDHFAHFPLTDKYTAANVSKIVGANWKVAIEAFLETYHTIITHAETLEWIGDVNTQYDIWNSTSRLFTLAAQPSPHLGSGYDPEATYQAAAGYLTQGGEVPDRPDGMAPRAAFADLTRKLMADVLRLDLSSKSDSEVIDGVQYFMFPNWFPWAGVVLGIQYRFRPNGHDPNTSIMDVRLLLPCPSGQPRPPAAKVRHLGLDEPFGSAPELMGLGPVLDQDVDNLPRIQRGLRASVTGAVTFSHYQESRIRHFHHMLDEILTD